MADLNTIAEDEYQPDEIFDVELDGPDELPLYCDDGSRMTIGIVGADSNDAVKARNANQNETFAKGFRAKLTAEGVQAKSDAYMASISKRWNIQIGGEKPVFSKAAAQKLYANPKLSFIRDKVEAANAERTNFLKKSPPSSAPTAAPSTAESPTT